MTGVEYCRVCREGLAGARHLAVVVPIYKSEAHIPRLLDFIDGINDQFPGGVITTFVIDGSPENECQLIERMMPSLKFPSQIIRLSRNFGVGPALHAALEKSSGCATVVFGSDLQEPIDLFLTFGRKIILEGRDVMLGQRITRDDPFMMTFFAKFYWWVNRHFLDNDSPKGGFDVFGLSKRAREALVALPELNTNITSQLQWIGFDRQYVPFHRLARQVGKSSWTMKRKIKLFADSIYGFSGTPITLVFSLGLLLTVLFGLLGVLTVIGAVMGWIEIPGYATIVLIGAIGHSLTIMVCGILGGYVFRTFENSKGRPRYIISEVITSQRLQTAVTASSQSQDISRGS